MALETDLRAQLGDLFLDAVRDHDDVMAECLAMLRIYALTPADLFYKYEAFLLERPSGLRAKLSVFTIDTAKELRRELQRAQQSAPVAAAGTSKPESARGGIGMRKARPSGQDIGGFASSPRGPSTSESLVERDPGRSPRPVSPSSYRPNGNYLETPVGKSVRSVSGASSPASDIASPVLESRPFRERLNPHTLVETLNGHLPPVSVAPAGKPRTILSSTSNPREFDYRYMFEKISQRSEMLDQTIDDFSDLMREAYNLQDFGDPHFPTDDSIYTVGRILSPPTDASKATSTSLVLESSRLLGSGRRIPLRFGPGRIPVRGGTPGLKTLSLFPGCITCVKGRNGGGGFFAVEEVLLAPPSNMPATSIEELLEHQERTGALSVYLAAGPFTLDDDLDFDPLQALCEVVETERPDALVLLGPFLDGSHPLLASTTRHPNDIFRDEVAARLARLQSMSSSTAIILIPSVRDIVSQHVVYPQAMLEKEALGLPKKIKCMPNPCTMSINEVLLGMSSVDVLFHLKREEVNQSAQSVDGPTGEAPDPMAGLARHILGQRSFYPLFPPPEALAGDVNLDISHQPLLRLDTAPDILILPSRLKHFSKVVDSTLVVNPGSLCRARTAGTFAKLHIHPIAKSKSEAEFVEHDIWDRTRAEIWRI